MTVNRTGCRPNVLFNERKLDSIEKIRAVIPVLIPSPSLEAELKNPLLWDLCQRRNLIVHKRGVVDRSYAGKVSNAPALGTRVEIFAEEILRYIELMTQLGKSMVVR